MRDFSELQPHFDGPQGAEQHGFVEITQVPDAKDLAVEATQPVTERDVETLQHPFAERIRIMSLRQHDRGEGVAVLTLVERIEFQSPSLNSGTCRFGESAVSGKHLI